MKHNHKIFIILLLLNLIACDGNNSSSSSQPQQSQNTGIIHTSSEIELLKARLFDNPTDFNALATLGDLYFESAQYLDAIATYDKALTVNPMSADCMNNKGLALFYFGDPNAALESLEQAVMANPTYVNAWLSTGFILVSEGRYEEALAPLNKVKELDVSGNLAMEADKFLAMVAENTTN